MQDLLLKICLCVCFTASVVCEEYDYYNPEESGDNEEDYSEARLEQIQKNPQFISNPKNIKVLLGGTINLPCQVNHLGPLVISWMKAGSHGEHPQYFASGNYLFKKEDTRISLINSGDSGSNLIIALAKPEDAGEYICETSSLPPARLRHQVSLIVVPKVSILKPPDSKIHAKYGDEVPLICSGNGDPKPSFRWYRQSMRMPDGRKEIEGQQLIFKNVSRKHSGKYFCEGSNGSGSLGRDYVEVLISYPPEVSVEESYIRTEESMKLELSCIVHAYPASIVTWYKDAEVINSKPSSSDDSTKTTKEYFLTIEDFSKEKEGNYTCKAHNHLGTDKATVSVVHLSL